MDLKKILLKLQEGKISREEAKDLLKNNANKKVFDKIAVIGMAGRYPGASNLDEYWELLKEGKDSIREIPVERFDYTPFFSEFPPKKGKLYCKWLGALKDIQYFDSLFFKISPYEAERMDPHQRLFLEEAYHAFENAGYSKETLSDVNCGVYFGFMGNEYGTMLQNYNLKVDDITGDSGAVAAARVSYYFNLRGPAISVDTACSSSLVCVNMAFQSLINQEIDMALVGGASLYLTPNSYVNMCSVGMLSPEGKCKTCDNKADGFVPGEGVGAIVLKRLEDAIRDGDYIYGTIIASGVNQDGRTNGITAPSMKRQKELELSIYNKYSINPESVTYVELHGTGTQLGDPIELEALNSAFQIYTNKRKFCAIGSVKTNIGHTSAASGIAGLQKVLLCMKNKKIVPTLNFENANNHFNFQESAFYVNTKLQNWKCEGVRRACVSSFGYSGTNAHIVLEEYNSSNSAGLESECFCGIAILSARNLKGLMKKAKIFHDYIDGKSNSILKNVIYTMQIGREEMECRAGFLVSSIKELNNKLNSIAEGVNDDEIYLSCHSENIEPIAVSDDVYKYQFNKDRRMELTELIKKWIEGYYVKWEKFYENENITKCILPGYPFEKVESWPIKVQRGELKQDIRNLTITRNFENDVIKKIEEGKMTKDEFKKLFY